MHLLKIKNVEFFLLQINKCLNVGGRENKTMTEEQVTLAINDINSFYSPSLKTCTLTYTR